MMLDTPLTARDPGTIRVVMPPTTPQGRGRAAVEALPASVKVGAFDYAIERWSACAAAGARRWGECSHTEYVIRVQVEVPSPVKAAEVFLHELSHAVFYVAGVEDDDKEERIVNLTAPVWLMVYRDNPWLHVWLRDALS